MKENLIDDFVNYVASAKIKSFRVYSNFHDVKIVRSVFTYRTYVDIFLISFMIYATVTIDDLNFYMIPVIAAWIFILGMTWLDFRSVNNLVIDVQNKNIQILNRNPLQRLILNSILKKRNRYDFNEISHFKVNSIYKSRATVENYSIELQLKSHDSHVIIKLSKEDQADQVAGFLNSFL
jgi:hypothetical protein